MLEQARRDVVSALGARRLVPLLGPSFALADIAEAHEAGAPGKVLVDLRR